MSFPVALPLTLSGVGLHSGQPCSVRIRPQGRPGICFLKGSDRIPAAWQNVSETARCTMLTSGSSSVRTVEHLMAALFALNVGGAEIEVQGPEIPAVDGSSSPWVEQLCNVTDCANWRVGDLPKTTEFHNGDSHYFCWPAPSLRIAVAVSFPGTLASWQVAAWDGEKPSFTRSVAPARTFCLASEYERLVGAGLAQGGAAENGFLLDDGPCLEQMRFPDEPARHKLLDLIGDLALLGFRPNAEILAIRPGHALNLRLCERIALALE